MSEDIYQRVTDRIVALIEAGDATGNWLKPWAVAAGEGTPANAVTGNEYHGVNVLMLWGAAVERGYPTNLWATYRQWRSTDAQVRKGERGEQIVFYKTLTPDEKDDSVPKDEKRRIPLMRFSTVFNVEQVDGERVDEWKATAGDDVERSEVELIDALDHYIEATGADVSYQGGRAFYDVGADRVVVPKAERFNDVEAFYSTVFHELTHWTGAASRLDRQLASRFGAESKAMEELIAELGAAFQCGRHRIEPEARPDHAEYVANWLRALRNDKKAIVTAASAAAKATDHLFELAGEAVPA